LGYSISSTSFLPSSFSCTYYSEYPEGGSKNNQQ
jgi:hypothetical protein